MSVDYSLVVNHNALGSTKRVRELQTLASVEESWERSITLDGCWLGRFRLSGLPLNDLSYIFHNWLGYDVQERAGGATWGGLVYEMELHHNLIRRRSIENIANRVRASYREMISNAGFENAGAAPPVFANWSQTIGAGDSITNETTNIGRGGHAAKLTNGGSGTTFVYQDVTVSAEQPYEISFYTRGDGTVGGRYRIYDVSGAADIIALTATGITGTDYRRVTEEILTPTGCTSLRLYLYAPLVAGAAYFDDASIQRQEDGSPVEEMTAAAADAASQTRYGVHEAILDNHHSKSDAEAARDLHLARWAWPVTERQEGRTGEEPYLEVMVAGYVFTTKWIYTSLAQYGSESDASDLVDTLLAECEFIRAVAVNANSTQVRLDDGPKTVRDALVKIIEAGDGAGNPWRLYVTHDRVAIYEPIVNTPIYHLRGGQFYPASGSRQRIAHTRHLRPGVVRDLDYPAGGTEPNSWFQDQRDFLLSEIAVGPGGLRWGIAEV